ncbi:hypothetical protein D1872_253090 [compost metagenome]
MNCRLPIWQPNDGHAAASDTEIQQFVHIPIFLHQHILADDPDISNSIFYIGGYIHWLSQNKFHSNLRQWNHKLASLIHVSRDLNPGLTEQGGSFFINTPFRHCNLYDLSQNSGPPFGLNP